MSFWLIFTIVTIINVVTYTTKSIATIKGGKWLASTMTSINAVVYILLVIVTVGDIPLWQKIVITLVCNFIGVFIVKTVEERLRKDKLWEIKVTIKPQFKTQLHEMLEAKNIPHHYYDLTKWFVFEIYSENQNQSRLIKEMITQVNGKYFASESQSLT